MERFWKYTPNTSVWVEFNINLVPGHSSGEVPQAFKDSCSEFSEYRLLYKACKKYEIINFELKKNSTDKELFFSQISSQIYT